MANKKKYGNDPVEGEYIVYGSFENRRRINSFTEIRELRVITMACKEIDDTLYVGVSISSPQEPNFNRKRGLEAARGRLRKAIDRNCPIKCPSSRFVRSMTKMMKKAGNVSDGPTGDVFVDELYKYAMGEYYKHKEAVAMAVEAKNKAEKEKENASH